MEKTILAATLCAFCFGDWIEFGVGKNVEPGYHKSREPKEYRDRLVKDRHGYIEDEYGDRYRVKRGKKTPDEIKERNFIEGYDDNHAYVYEKRGGKENVPDECVSNISGSVKLVRHNCKPKYVKDYEKASKREWNR